MQYIVLYSSRTGNTKKIAEAIGSVLPAATPCLPVGEAPVDLNAYDCVFAGFWVDRGSADPEAQQLLRQLEHPRVALFATLGADPKSQHAADSLSNAAALRPGGQPLVHSFICQGKVDPELIEQMKKMFPAGHPHAVDEKREALHKEASKHPDEADLAAAKAFAAETVKRLENLG
ncbi:flavodoxin family protein [Sporomusa termitida]|uniref:Flavodoxin domain protein n=1 Tax=Sporomusa termitida TaxID=2377 RepID=A0A517DZC6_9FIRM|nr:flavodoxin family protein [Sporomusa termitida]QDR82691.1 Flavodoxin domain protein [Sporomusa termitida]